MTSVRKRKAKRSSLGKATRRNKDRQRKINIAGNPIIASNWDYSLTLKQNYKKLGLRSRLQKPTGGEEITYDSNQRKMPMIKVEIEDDSDDDFLEREDYGKTEDDEFEASKIPEGEARIIRGKDGNILEVIYGQMKKLHAFDDKLRDRSEGELPKTDVIRRLEKMANTPWVKKDRSMSTREEGWLQKLYHKHGDDYKKMFFDTKLNVYQQSEGDLRRRICAWKIKYGIE